MCKMLTVGNMNKCRLNITTVYKSRKDIDLAKENQEEELD